ncbi:MAG: hypothetical protein D6696_11475 [Acidobacteria bacterium]|nr:MAG: hypothetical protein D6696_11475 [Acidobacteriota bacterium]
MADLDDLLEKTSRTFALTIPLLPEPTRREVTVSYLLFRIADTFEDSASWPRATRIAALDDFAELLVEPRPEQTRRLAAEWNAAMPIDHEGYQELLVETPAVIEAYFDLAPAARERIRHHTTRTARGMAGFVARTDDDGHLQLRDLDDLRAYCYVVAGIVGELCTDLVLLDRPALAPVAGGLRRRAARFGEALQLVNILKDSAFDATEGRSYLPPDLDRATVMALAREDLGIASEYVALLERAGAERGVIAFNALPVLLAYATLDTVEEQGPGAKISRPQVFAIVAGLQQALDQGRPAIDRP